MSLIQTLSSYEGDLIKKFCGRLCIEEGQTITVFQSLYKLNLPAAQISFRHRGTFWSWRELGCWHLIFQKWRELSFGAR